MSQATEMLAAYLAAETAILEGKEARIGDRAVRLEDLAEIRAGRIEWQRRVDGELLRASGRSTIGGLGFSVARMDD